MGKNIFDLYKDENEQVTVESAVVATPIELILADAEFEDVEVTIEQALAHAETIDATGAAIAQFEKDFAQVEDALAKGEVTVESAQQAAKAYDALCTGLNITPEQLDHIGCAVLTTEDSSKYPEATAQLTKEGATKLIETIKAKVMEIIQRIANMLKTTGVKIVSYALGNEDKAVQLQKQVNNDLTDEIKDGKEIEFEFVASRMAVFGSLSKDNVAKLISHANDEGVAGAIKAAFDKDVAGKEFKEIYMLKNGVAAVDAKLFESKDKGEVVSVYPLGIDGDSVSALVTRKDGEKHSIAKESAKVTKLDGFKGNKPLTRKEIVDLAGEVVKVSKKQKDLVKKITGYVEMPKITEGDDSFLKEVPGVLNTVTAAYIALAMSSATTNRSVLAILANSASLYKKKGEEKKEEEK